MAQTSKNAAGFNGKTGPVRFVVAGPQNMATISNPSLALNSSSLTSPSVGAVLQPGHTQLASSGTSYAPAGEHSSRPYFNQSIAGSPIVIAPELKFSCNFCSEVFESEGELDLHGTYAHSAELDSPRFSCPVCKAVYPRKGMLDEHLKIHAPNLVICSVCNEPFDNNQELLVHKREKHDSGAEVVKPFVCMYCKLRYAKRQELLAHLSLEHPEDGHKCDVCEQTFQSKDALKLHMLTHLPGPNPQISGFTIPLSSQQSTAGSGTPIPSTFTLSSCPTPSTRPVLPVCSLVAATPTSTLRHPHSPIGPVSIFPENPRCPHKCGICSMTFETRKILDTHMTTHITRSVSMENGPLSVSLTCDICGKVSTSNEELNIHMATHMTPVPVLEAASGPPSAVSATVNKCEICKNVFPTVGDLNTHMATHITQVISLDSDEALSPPSPLVRPASPKIPQTCNVCHQDFECEEALTIHLEKHIQQAESVEDERSQNKDPHRCYMCDTNEVFQSEEELSQHLGRHASSSSCSLPRAAGVSHGPLGCSLCPLRFRSASKLQAHQKRQHPTHNPANLTKSRHSGPLSSGSSTHNTKQAKNPPRTFTCQLCHGRFQSKTDLDEHKKRQHDRHYRLPYRCDTCGMLFVNTEEFEAHMDGHVITPDDVTVETAAENISKKTSSQLSRAHKSTAQRANKKDLTCKVCSRRFVYQANLEMHMAKMHEEAGECRVCGKAGFNMEDLKIHLKKHEIEDATTADAAIITSANVRGRQWDGASKDMPVKVAKAASSKATAKDLPDQWRCKLCRISFKSKTELNKHLQDHRGHVTIENGELECLFCALRFDSCLDLKVHMAEKKHLMINAGEQYRCDYCKERYESLDELHLHLKTHYQHDFECFICNRWMKGLPEMVKHLMNTHEEMYLCKLCGKVLTDEAEIKRELRQHKLKLRMVSTGQFQCDYCGKKYTNELILQKHMVAHKHLEKNKDGKYECAFCDKCFIEAVRLHSHLSAHVTEVVACYLCGETFKGVVAYNRHLISIHNEHTNPICAACNKSTKSKQDLKSFKQLPYNSNLYQCSKCDKVYESEDLQTLHKNSAFKCIKYQIGVTAAESMVCFDDELRKKTQDVIDLTDVEETIGVPPTLSGGVKPKISPQHRETNSGVLGTDDLESQFQQSSSMRGPTVDITDDVPGPSRVEDPRSKISVETIATTKSTKNKSEEKLSLKGFSVLEEVVEVLDDDDDEGEERKAASSLTVPSSHELPASNSRHDLSTDLTCVEDSEVEADTHYGERDILCDECGQNISSSAQLKDHMKLHEDYGPMLCTLCGLVFNIQSEGYLHKLREHKEEDPMNWLKDLNMTSMICLLCHQSFRTEKELKEHLQAHRDGPADEADVKDVHARPETSGPSVDVLCGDKSPRTRNITTKYQVRGLNLLRKNRCKECKKSFKGKKELKLHFTSLHSGKCEYCWKVFTSPLRLSVHRRNQHSGRIHVASFKCCFCFQNFNGRIQLDKHKEFVHGCAFKKIFRCHSCMKKFKIKELLVKHKESVHRPKTRKCKTCKRYIKDYLMKHHETNVNCFLGF